MSRLNKIRIINLNYNRNESRIDDETFDLGGKNTLLALQNGGGKSVIVQMIIALFVHGKYRNMGERKYKDYFTLNTPTIIMAEWQLDNNAGYVITGSLVRKSTDTSDDAKDLEMINFIGDYVECNCEYSIDNIGFIECTADRKLLKKYGDCRRLLESYKKTAAESFSYYDMNQSQKRYFDRLMEYRINYREWETIIHKINEDESGLSNLFKNVKDERGLTEKWFLKAVEDKLAEDTDVQGNNISIVKKYINQYRENQSKISKKENILLFREKSYEVKKSIGIYAEAEHKKQEHSNGLVSMLDEFESVRESYEESNKKLEELYENLIAAKQRRNHEKISRDMYQLIDRIDVKESQLNNLRIVINSEQDKYDDIQHKINIMSVARDYEDYTYMLSEVNRFRDMLEVERKSESEKTPEANRLGCAIYQYYNNLMKQCEERIREVYNEKNENEIQCNENIIEKSIIKDRLEKISRELGVYEERIKNYTRSEEAYNRQYDDDIARMIDGEYEAGYLEHKRDTYSYDREQLQKTYDYVDKKIVTLMEEYKNANRKIKELETEKIQNSYKLEAEDKVLTKMKSIIDNRERLIKYVNVSGDYIFNLDYILREYDKRIEYENNDILEINKSIDRYVREKNRLIEGHMIELPEGLEERFNQLGIPVVYGMEWLKKNGYTLKKNNRLVENNPFIPYSLILSSAQISKLKASDMNLYTSFPVPIIERERLEESSGDVCIESLGIHFYVLFNSELLDEEKVIIMQQNIAAKISNEKMKLEEKKTELDIYMRNREEIKANKLTSEEYYAQISKIDNLKLQGEQIRDNIDRIQEECSHMESDIELCKRENGKTKEAIRRYDDMIEHLYRLADDYREYVMALHEQIEADRTYNQLKTRDENIDNLLNKLEHDKADIDAKLRKNNNEKEKAREKVVEYIKYNTQYDADKELIINNRDIGDYEGRYKILTVKIADSIKSIEDNLKRSTDELQKRNNRVKINAEKSNVSIEEYTAHSYDAEADIKLSKSSKELELSLREKSNREKELDKQLVAIKKEYEIKSKDLNSSYGELLAREEIPNIDYEMELVRIKSEEVKVKKDIKIINDKLSNIKANITSLEEYRNLVSNEDENQSRLDIINMEEKDIDKNRAELVRDYKEAVSKLLEEKNNLLKTIRSLEQIPEFADSYISIPISNMIKIAESENADAIAEHFDNVVLGFDKILDKLSADLESFTKERDSLKQTLLEYVRQVNDNLMLIDKNSTISVRDHRVKMLKIIVPEWNDAIADIRITDYLDKIRGNAMEIYDRNDNPDEYISNQITTSLLYDAVMGISNVMVSLYKIEADREIKITWKESMKNSGGEGFLSAFVILSSLLDYMGQSKNDSFYERNQGKVLIMDNPFAKAHSAHLLKPVMEMAKKTNTQLVCLSAVSGGSIYDRFDNIYVLNLIPSASKKGLNIIKSEHTKGNEMVDSRINVESIF